MNDSSTTSETFAIQGFTPYAQVPRWIIRSGSQLSHGAVRLYGVIMTYADNDTRAAFPGKEKLSQDIGSSVRSVFTYMKELEAFGALIVTRRRNKRTGNYYANHYVLVFNDPSAVDCRRPSEVDGPISKPTVNLDSPSPTSEQSSDNQKESSTIKQSSITPNPGNLSPLARATLRHALQKVGQSIKDGHGFYTDRTQDLWWGFTEALEMIMPDEYEGMADLIENGKWTVSAAVASPYAAGRELNTLINTAAKY